MGRRAAHWWFVHRDETVLGPFPRAEIERGIVLGRIPRSARLSPDGVTTIALESYPGFEDLMMAAASAKARARYDERRVERRETARAAGDTRPDRRAFEPQVRSAKRRAAMSVWRGLRPRPIKTLAPAVLLVIALGVVVIAGIETTQNTLREPIDCTRAPLPDIRLDNCHLVAVNWRGQRLPNVSLKNAVLSNAHLAGITLFASDLSFADLRGADLSLGDLRTARFTGADLRGANLSHADVAQADFSFADLRGARIEGTNFSAATLRSAIWVDGRRCRPEGRVNCGARANRRVPPERGRPYRRPKSVDSLDNSLPSQ